MLTFRNINWVNLHVVAGSVISTSRPTHVRIVQNRAHHIKTYHHVYLSAIEYLVAAILSSCLTTV